MTYAQEVPPEIPVPGPEFPRRRPDAPAVAPPLPLISDDAAVDPRALLLRQRRVMLTGAIDDDVVTRAAAELMMLDGESSRPVEVIVNSDGGPVHAALGLLDVLDLMRAPVATRCIGRAIGTAAVVLASGTRGRSAASGARIGLRLHDRYDVSGRAVDIERFAEQLDHARDQVAARLRRVTQLDDAQIAHELESGEPMTAEAARRHGLVDEIIRR